MMFDGWNSLRIAGGQDYPRKSDVRQSLLLEVSTTEAVENGSAPHTERDALRVSARVLLHFLERDASESCEALVVFWRKV